MVLRILGSAAVAAALLASDLVLLVLYLNPEVALRREAPSLLVSLFVPYVLGGAVLFTLLGVGLVAAGAPRLARPPLPSWPWFTALTGTSVTIAALLFA